MVRGLLSRTGAALAAAVLMLVPCAPATAATTGNTALYMPQTSGAGTANGDYVTATAGLNTTYHYFVEVPPGLSRLRIGIFDPDFGAGTNEDDAQRDRARDAFDSVTYTLLRPDGTTAVTQTCTAGVGTGFCLDNTWVDLYDSTTALTGRTAPAFASVQSAVKANGGGTSISIAQPGGTAQNDLLVAIIGHGASGSAITATGPGTWTAVSEGSCGGTGTGCEAGVFYHVVGAGETGPYAFALGGLNREAAGAILRFTGVDTTNPVEVAASAASAVSGTAVATPSATAGSASTAWFACLPPATRRPRTPSLERVDVAQTGTNGIMVSAADAILTTVAASGAENATIGVASRWRAFTLILRGQVPVASLNGHWELQVDEPGGNSAINAFGLRADDGDGSSAGTEIPIYYDSHNQFGQTPPATGSGSKAYDTHPYITSGCSASENDFDFDSNSGTVGSVALSSRTGVFANTIPSASLSVNNTWARNTFTGWANDLNSIEDGIWTSTVNISNYTVGGTVNGNYANIWYGNSSVAANPPGANPTTNAFRVYLPTDNATTPVKLYVEQLARFSGCGVSGPNPPVVGQTSCYTVTVRVVNPEAQAVTFSAGNLVTANIPGAGVVYAGLTGVTQGTIVTQPAVGGTGSITWNPGTVAAGSTVLLDYKVKATPASAGQRLPLTGTPALNGTTAKFVDNTGNATRSRATLYVRPCSASRRDPGPALPALARASGPMRTASGGRGVGDRVRGRHRRLPRRAFRYSLKKFAGQQGALARLGEFRRRAPLSLRGPHGFSRAI